MGRYLMKQQWMSWGDDYAIQDADGNEVFFVDGKAFSWGDKLSIQDGSGREVAFIQQRLFTWGPTYEISYGGRVVAVVKKEAFTFFQCRFTVDVPGPDDLEAVGDFSDHEYEFRRGGELVARVSKQWFTWTDTYGIDVAPNEDDVLVIASAVVVDLCCHGRRR